MLKKEKKYYNYCPIYPFRNALKLNVTEGSACLFSERQQIASPFVNSCESVLLCR